MGAGSGAEVGLSILRTQRKSVPVTLNISSPKEVTIADSQTITSHTYLVTLGNILKHMTD